MFVRIHSAVVSGPTVQPVTVEVASSKTSLPTVSIIGLPGASVVESKDRVFSALRSLRIALPHKRIVISLRPVEVQKSGSSLDLAIALGVLMVHGIIPVMECAAIGELGLDGSLHAGSEYPALLKAVSPEKNVFFPHECGSNPLPQIVNGKRFSAVSTLRELYLALTGACCFLPVCWDKPYVPVRTNATDVTASQRLLRTVAISLSGGHHTLLFGSPGVGKSYTRQLIEMLLPDETPEQIDDRLTRENLWNVRAQKRPIISPHHSASLVGLVGGGSVVRPGAISYAHRGILFLDELPEFQRVCLEALRQPLESETLTIVRGSGSWELPCSFTLIGTANPCPCGYRGTNYCRCSETMVLKYRERISGPILDRMDIQLRVTDGDRHFVSAEKLRALQQKITTVRRLQEQRVASGIPAFARQYELAHLELLRTTKRDLPIPVKLTADWSLRRWLKFWRVVQTIADFEGRPTTKPDLIEAFGMVRPLFGDFTRQAPLRGSQ